MYEPSPDQNTHDVILIYEHSAQGWNFNTMIRRAAHVEFLEANIYAKFIMWSFPRILDDNGQP
jgi:hypothetical protein